MYQNACGKCSYIRDDVSKRGVTLTQPTTRSNTIGLVLKLLWSHLIEILEAEMERKVERVRKT